MPNGSKFSWEDDLRSLAMSTLVVMRDGLRDDFSRACFTFNITNMGLAKTIRDLSVDEIRRLAIYMQGQPFVRLDQSRAFQTIIKHAKDPAGPGIDRISLMAMATSQEDPDAQRF